MFDGIIGKRNISSVNAAGCLTMARATQTIQDFATVLELKAIRRTQIGNALFVASR
jgi:hypothetical protein